MVLLQGAGRIWTILALIFSFPALCIADIGITTQTLAADIYPIGSISVTPSASLYTVGTTFQSYTGTVTVSYWVRTTTGGGGSVTLKAGSDFAPSGGPSVSAGKLTYACSGASLGTGCSGTHTISTTSQTPVVTLPASACTGGGGACSSGDPNQVSVGLVLTNSPAYKTGSYSTSLLFTISAL